MRKNLCKSKSRVGVKVPKTSMKVKRSLQGNLTEKSQTSTTHSKKLKEAKSTMLIFFQVVNKKLSKREGIKVRQDQPVPEQETLEKPTTSHNLCNQ
ncbi:hypothetical protein MUG91_G70n5 [Manis pentadactyla]|nr:hypothetical protein MUG91_G70n5 [Manis pentadactyla]